MLAPYSLAGSSVTIDTDCTAHSVKFYTEDIELLTDAKKLGMRLSAGIHVQDENLSFGEPDPDA